MTKSKNLSAVFLSIRGRLMKAVSHIVPPKDIEDIVQETYVRACQADKTKTINCHQSFMFVTARNLAFDHIKRADNRLTSNFKDNTGFDSSEFSQLQHEPYEQAISNSEFAAFCEAVRQLPVKCRRTFVLKKVYGYSQKEISQTLGISESTVEKHISTGIKRCMQYMNKQTDRGDSGHLSPTSNNSAQKKVVPLPYHKESKS